MLISGGLLSGCSGGGESKAIQIMKWFPATGEVYEYLNLAALREPQFSSDYRSLASGFIDFERYGINLDDVTWMVVSLKISTAENSTAAIVLSGHFNSNDMRNALNKAGNKGSYRSIEIWTGFIGGGAVALRNGLVIVGENADIVYECIDVITGMEQSLYDNTDLREAIGELPQKALEFIAMTSGQSFPSHITGCVAYAFAFDGINAKTMGVTWVGKFRDSSSASSSLLDFKSWTTAGIRYTLENVQAVQEGQFIKVTATFPISELTAE
jgi:hypothetical protein